ncbi:MAG TPA: DJ-1/PfpI family protein [Nocardioides sp.]|uniref:DJ-1/PfpI family protein n=1 Tax=Nocardioides sp. TaxID=35761 RepID=UPI002D7FAF9F|nr:DJ-1/PfpI family protein [Nocardioides sp.]HET6651620.1 DJ-1/PfpI family protein [Nocardioides sp.]
MKVAHLLYPGFTAIDVVGTFQVLVAAPGIESVFVAAEAGAVVDDTGLCALRASAGIADVASADVVVVPGSDRVCDPDATLVEWLRVVHPTTTWTLSVGTGSSYLAASGALAGATAATTHWASAQRLTDAGITYCERRVVRAGKVLTSAGASAGIDLALTLLGLSHGPAVAQTVQLALEYDPQPPYDAGSPAKAPAEIGEIVSSYYAQRCS